MSEVLIGESARTGSESEADHFSWAVIKERSAVRKAWVRTVEMVGGEREKAEGEKRRK